MIDYNRIVNKLDEKPILSQLPANWPEKRLSVAANRAMIVFSDEIKPLAKAINDGQKSAFGQILKIIQVQEFTDINAFDTSIQFIDANECLFCNGLGFVSSGTRCNLCLGCGLKFVNPTLNIGGVKMDKRFISLINSEPGLKIAIKKEITTALPITGIYFKSNDCMGFIGGIRY